MNEHRGRQGCKIISATRETCYIRFGQRTAVRASAQTWVRETVRGETIIFDLDAAGRVLGIELVGEGKPCQAGQSRG